MNGHFMQPCDLSCLPSRTLDYVKTWNDLGCMLVQGTRTSSCCTRHAHFMKVLKVSFESKWKLMPSHLLTSVRNVSAGRVEPATSFTHQPENSGGVDETTLVVWWRPSVEAWISSEG